MEVKNNWIATSINVDFNLLGKKKSIDGDLCLPSLQEKQKIYLPVSNKADNNKGLVHRPTLYNQINMPTSLPCAHVYHEDTLKSIRKIMRIYFKRRLRKKIFIQEQDQSSSIFRGKTRN